MTMRRSSSFALPALLLLAGVPAFAQNSNYSTDCEAARKALSINNPRQLAPCSPSVSTLSTKQMVQMQVASTLIDAFVNMLFSNDSQANAQKQKMMAELQARQAEAERQKQHEEALRLAAICSRLQTTLKLSGLPQLQFKSSGQAEGLRLKLGDSSDAHVGVPGLPGIALNDNTGNGGGTPYGIAGLPGIYTNGPATSATAPSGNPQSGTGGLALKVGDGSNSSSPPVQQAQASPSAQSGLVVDPRTMTPQQLADLASNLPPEQQQQLLNALQAGSSANAPASTPSSLGASSPAMGQLQQTAAASNAAAIAATSEGAASDARIGFDQAGGSLPVAPSNGGGLAASSTSSSAQPSAVAPTGKSSPSTANPAIPTTVNVAVLVPPPSLTPVSSGSANTAAVLVEPGLSPFAPAPSRIQQMTDQQLQEETCRARAMLLRIGADSRKGSQELDEMAKEIRETRREAVKAGLGCFSELAQKALSDKLDDKLEAEEKRTHDAAFEKDARELLKKAQDLQTEISKTTVEYQESDRTRDEKLEAALKYLNAFYEYVHKGKAFPWVASAQCAIDFGYLATKVYMEQQQVSLLSNNQDSAAGSLKAESSVAAFHKKLVDESLRRGLDPQAAVCH